MKTTAVQMRLLTDYGIRQYALGEMDQQTASIAKYLTCEKLCEVGSNVSWSWSCTVLLRIKAAEMYGLDGLVHDDDQKIGSVICANRVMPIWAGTSEIMLELVSRTI